MFYPNTHFYSKPFKIFQPKNHYFKWNSQNGLKLEIQTGRSFQISIQPYVSTEIPLIWLKKSRKKKKNKCRHVKHLKSKLVKAWKLFWWKKKSLESKFKIGRKQSSRHYDLNTMANIKIPHSGIHNNQKFLK